MIDLIEDDVREKDADSVRLLVWIICIDMSNRIDNGMFCAIGDVIICKMRKCICVVDVVGGGVS